MSCNEGWAENRYEENSRKRLKNQDYNDKRNSKKRKRKIESKVKRFSRWKEE
jgi:hypothetical protein